MFESVDTYRHTDIQIDNGSMGILLAHLVSLRLRSAEKYGRGETIQQKGAKRSMGETTQGESTLGVNDSRAKQLIC